MDEIREAITESWHYLRSKAQAAYEIAGKYLFFSEDRNKLLDIARNEILQKDW